MAESFTDWLKARNSTSAFSGLQPASSDAQQTVYGQGPVGAQPSGSGSAGAHAAPAPNYQQLLTSSPELSFANREAMTGSAMDASSRAAAIRRAVVELGVVPDFKKAGQSLGIDSLGYLQSDIDDNTRQLAQKNTDEGLSLMARLQHEHERVKRQTEDVLAARGIFRSGETGFQLGEQGLKYKQAVTDAEKAVLDHLSGIIGTFVTNERDRRNMVAQALFAAMGRLSKSPAPGGGGGAAAPAPEKAAVATPDPFLTDPQPRQLPWWAQREAI